MEDALPEYLVIDGGMGSEIRQRIGIPFADPLWGTRANLTEADVVMGIHREYLEAGADIIIANTYKPRVESLMDALSLDREGAMDVLRKVVRDTCTVRDQFWDSVKNTRRDRTRPLVVGALGPFSAGTPGGSDYAGIYIDTTLKTDMMEIHRDKVRALLDGGADMLAFETVPAPKESEAICELMAEFPEAKAWIVFCCKDGEHVCHGEKFKDAVLTSLASDCVVGVGVNCSKPEDVTSLLNQIPGVVRERKRIIVYPNNGQVYEPGWRRWGGDPDTKPLHQYVSDWLAAGANWIGGCCHVSPEHIAPIRNEMDKYIKS